jgi:adenylate cyclase, class 2
MTKEIEVKILNVDQEKIKEKLKNLDAKKIYDGNIKTLFFDFKDNRISREKDILRLREKENEVDLTYKKVSGTLRVKTAEEYSVSVSNSDAMKKVLENIGLKVILNMEKHRSSYKIGKIRFDFDRYLGNYEFIPEFLEIEADDIILIYKIASQLGFKPEDCLSWSTEELIQYYKKKKGRASN